MAERFINIDHDTPILLPVDLRDWIAEGHFVYVVSNHLTGSSSDRRELIPALDAAAENGYKVTSVLADNGYYSESNPICREVTSRPGLARPRRRNRGRRKFFCGLCKPDGLLELGLKGLVLSRRKMEIGKS